MALRHHQEYGYTRVRWRTVYDIERVFGRISITTCVEGTRLLTAVDLWSLRSFEYPINKVETLTYRLYSAQQASYSGLLRLAKVPLG